MNYLRNCDFIKRWLGVLCLPILLSAEGLDHELFDLSEGPLAEYLQSIDSDVRTDDAIIQYFRGRTQNDRFLPNMPTWDARREELARQGLDDFFELQGVTGQISRLEDGSIDWLYTGPKDDQEWAWMFNRQRYFLDWIVAYQQTGEEAFVEQLSFHIVDFVGENPYPGRLTFSAPWRPLEVARRVMEAWIPALYLLQNETAFRDEAWRSVLQSIPDHADSMMNYHSFSGNHLITEMVALAKLAIFFPEYKDADMWLDYAIQTAMDELFSQTYPDGAYKELSNHYQRVVLFSYEQFRNVLIEANRPKEFQLVSDRLSKMWGYFVGVMRPNGFGPINSDSDLEHNEEIAQPFRSKYLDADWVKILEARQSMRGRLLSKDSSRYFEWAGHWVSRDDWGRGSDWGFFDMGPHGTAHQHDDELHFSLSLGGRDLLVDTGRYWYVPGIIRNYFAGEAGHNTMSFEERKAQFPLNEVSQPIDNYLADTEEWSAAIGDKRFVGKTIAEQVVQTRIVLHWRSQGWFVVDHVLSMSPVLANTHWHFHPDWKMVDEQSRWKLSHREDENRQVFVGSYPQTSDWVVQKGEQSAVHFAGWYSVDYNQRIPCPLLSLRESHEGSFFRGWSFSGRQDIQIESLVQEGQDLILRLRSGTEEKTFIINLIHHHVREK